MPFGKIENLQDLIYDNRTNIDDGLYVKLMDCLQEVHKEESCAECIVECVMLVVKPTRDPDEFVSCDFSVKMCPKVKLLTMQYNQYKDIDKRIKAQGYTISQCPCYLRRYKRKCGFDSESIIDRESDDDEEDYHEGTFTLCTDNVVFLKITLKKGPEESSLLQKKEGDLHVEIDSSESSSTSVTITNHFDEERDNRARRRAADRLDRGQ